MNLFLHVLSVCSVVCLAAKANLRGYCVSGGDDNGGTDDYTCIWTSALSQAHTHYSHFTAVAMETFHFSSLCVKPAIRGLSHLLQHCVPEAFLINTRHLTHGDLRSMTFSLIIHAALIVGGKHRQILAENMRGLNRL